MIENILEEYKSHPSIKKIIESKNHNDNFTFREVSENEVLKLLKTIDSKKAIGVDGIPPLIVKLSAEVLSNSLTRIINQSIKENTFPTLLKIAAILPFYKKDDRSDKKNY